MTILDLTGINQIRTDLHPSRPPARTPEEWFHMSCEIAARFGARIIPETHGVRCDFGENSPSLVIWSTGFWFDHRGGERGGTTNLIQHLREVRGLSADDRQGGSSLTDTDWAALSAHSHRPRSRSALSPIQAESRWSQLLWTDPADGDLTDDGHADRRSKLSMTNARRAADRKAAARKATACKATGNPWPESNPPAGCSPAGDVPPAPEVYAKQQASVLDYFHSRGLSTAWCHADIIGTRPLQDTPQERQQQDLGADFIFAIPYKPFAHFLPGTNSDPQLNRMCGMQRTFLAHGEDDYHPVRKTGRAMLGTAGMTHIRVPADPHADSRGCAPARGWGASDTTILQLMAHAGEGKKLLFYSEGLESGLSVAQQTGGVLNVLWSTSGFLNLSEAILDLDVEVMPPPDPDEIHILLVDVDKNREGEKAAAYLGRTLEAIGRRVLYLLPPPPAGSNPPAGCSPDDPVWTGDWNDVLLEGRMDSALQTAIQNASENLRHAPLRTPPEFVVGDILRAIPVIPRPQLQDIDHARIAMNMREYNRKHMDADALLGVHTYMDATGAGKTSMLAKLPSPEGSRDHLVVATPQRRDAGRILDTNRETDGTYYLRNSRTNTITDDDAVGNLITDRLDANNGNPLWTRDSDFMADADTIQRRITDRTLPACYRDQLQGGVQMDLLGALSQENGELHPQILTQQHHGCARECATCAHGMVADTLIRALQKPDEAEAILEELDAPVKNLSPYSVYGQDIAVTHATLGQFLPCAAQLNRRLSYREKAVCTTTALLQYDRRLFAQATAIQQDEMPALIAEQAIGTKEFFESRGAIDHWIGNQRFLLAQMPDTPANQKRRKELQQSITSAEKVILSLRFLHRHFLDVMADEPLMDAKSIATWIKTKKVQRKIIIPFLKSIRAQKIQHEAPYEQPYTPSPHSRRKVTPTVFIKSLALALEHGSIFFQEGAEGIAGRRIILHFPTTFGEELRASQRGESKKSIGIYTATPDMALIEMSREVIQNFAEDHVHLVWRPINHTKTAHLMNPKSALHGAQRILQAYWDQGLKVAILVSKAMAPDLQAWARKTHPGYEYLIGWIGKHHVAHNDWSDCDGLVIWTLDLPPAQVLAREFLATRRIFDLTQWADLDEFANPWDSSGMDYVPFPHLGYEVLARVFSNPDFNHFVRWRASQIITQAVGRLRGVNNPAGAARKKFCDVYSEIAPIDGLFGTYIDEVIPAEFLSPEILHRQAVERLATIISGYQISLPDAELPSASLAGDSPAGDSPSQGAAPCGVPTPSQGANTQTEILPVRTKTIRMSVRELQKTAKKRGLSGFQSENLREALELLKESRPDVLDYNIQPGKATEIIVRTDLPIPAPEQPQEDRVFTLLGQLIQQRRDAGGDGDIQFNIRELYRILEPQQYHITPGWVDQQAVFQRLQEAFPGILVEERTADDDPKPWTYIRFRPDTPSQVLGNAGIPTVGGVYNNDIPGQHHPAPCPADVGLADNSPPKTVRNGDVITLQIQGTQVKAFVGVQNAPGSLPGDPDPSRVFPAFEEKDFLNRLLQREGQWYRAAGAHPPAGSSPAGTLSASLLSASLTAARQPSASPFQGGTPLQGASPLQAASPLQGTNPKISPEIARAFEQRIGLDYRKDWVRWLNVPEHPVIETLAILTHFVDSYLTLQHPESLSVLPALDEAERTLAAKLREDPLLQALLDDWRDHPGLPRLDLSKPLQITSSRFRRDMAQQWLSG